MKLKDLGIGQQYRPFIVAEMSGNHNQSLETALALVEAAAAAGVQALKLQTYTADTLTIPSDKADFIVQNSFEQWGGQTLYELYKKAYTPWEWHKPIFEKCKQLGLIAFSTPFDHTAVDFLESLHVPCYKIASFENTDVDLIRKVSSTGKPIIISTGLATIAELHDAVQIIRETGNQELVLLKCTSSYPASPAYSNLRTLPHMRELFQCEVGLSDHTLGIGAAIASIAFGASVIEKHFVLSRAAGGVDATFSLEPSELKMLVLETEAAWQSLGQVWYGPTEAELDSLKFRRSLYFVQNMKKGDQITPQSLRSIRPGYGIPVKYRPKLLNRRVNQDIEAGTAVSWEVLV